jgi:hypothetical protein
MLACENKMPVLNDDTNRIFKSWVPNVSGALSFSALGSGAYPTRPVRANIGDHRVRYVIAFQERDLLDSLIKFIAPSIGYTGDFFCICVGKSSDNPLTEHDELVGRLAIFHEKKAWIKEHGPFFVQKQNILRSFPSRSISDDNVTLEVEFEDHFQEIQKYIALSSSFYVDFRLTRDGITTLCVPSQVEKYFPDDDVKRHHMEKIVVSQAFFFLKDLAHNHQHHHHKLDTLVDVHFFAGDERAWRSCVLRFLYRKIIECKRDVRPEAYNSSLGILIYAKSFKKITERELGNDVTLLPNTDDILLEESIRAGFQNSNHKEEKQEFRLINRLILFISGGTLLLTLVLLLSLTSFKIDHTKTDGALVVIGCFLVKHTSIVAGLILAVYAIFTLRFKGKHDLADQSLIRYFFKWLQCFNQRIAGIIAIAVGILVLLITLLGSYWLVTLRYPENWKAFFRDCSVENRDGNCSCAEKQTTQDKEKAVLDAKIKAEAELAAKINVEAELNAKTKVKMKAMGFQHQSKKHNKQATVLEPCLTPQILCFRPMTSSRACKNVIFTTH